MVELRKRKEAPPPAASPPARKKGNAKAMAEAPPPKVPETNDPEPSEDKALAETEARAHKDKVEDIKADNGGKPQQTSAPLVGHSISLEGFGGPIETHDGKQVTLKKLVEKSKAGVILFTYPKASTPGCTKQACLFRDSYTPLTATGFSIYGLSLDSAKANTTFKTKQNLPYTLLCDPKGTLIKAIGLAKPPKGTVRGVFVVDKEGRVLAAEPGGPDATVEVVRSLIGGMKEPIGNVAEGEAVLKEVEEGKPSGDVPLPTSGAQEDKAAADTAGEVADTAAKIDDGDSKL